MPPIDTPLAAEHDRLRARMADFAGFRMPIVYTSVLEEAKHVRNAAGLFDLCHMGRVYVRGPGHVEWIDRLVTCDVTGLVPGRIRYGLLVRENGTTIDDVLVYREEECVILCVNASNRHRDLAWLETHAAGTEVEIDDASERLGMIAIQGPRSVDICRRLCAGDPGDLRYYRFFRASFAGVDDVLVSRTGYTGEDGFEFFLPAEAVVDAWCRLLEAGDEDVLRPIGLAARDTLRLEAGMPLYGHEIDDETTPIEAGLEFAVSRKFDFLGGEVLRRQMKDGTSRRLIGFTCGGRRIPRQHCAIVAGDEPVGDVRSGTFSPTLETNIGTAFITSSDATRESSLSVDLRGDRVPIEVVPLPFYRRES